MTSTTLILSSEQIAQLHYAYNVNSNANQDFSGVWHDSYSVLYGYLTTTSFIGIDSARSGVDRQTWLWLKGARFVNSNEGAFGTLIRAYTIAQYKQRYGKAPDPAVLNRASNAIAKAFIGQWLGLNKSNNFEATQPDIKETELRCQFTKYT